MERGTGGAKASRPTRRRRRVKARRAPRSSKPTTAEGEGARRRTPSHQVRVQRTKTSLRKVEGQLARLGAEVSGESREVSRRREALRRRRIALLITLERLLRLPPGRFDPRNVPGFRYGLRSIASGGLPGLGKR